MKKRTLRLLTLALLAVLTLCLLPNAASAAEKEQLGTPADLTWNQYVDFNNWPHEPEQYYGCVSWKPTAPISPDEPIQFEVKVYKDNKLWQTILQGFGPQVVAEDQFISCDVYAFKDFESGTYYFTVQAIDNSGTYASSKVAKSGTWKYVKPSKSLTAPTNLRWDTKDTINGWWPWAKWDAVSGDAPQYELLMYYRPTKDAEWSWFHQQWKITGTKNAPPSFAIEDGLFGPGYYRFKVRTLSEDITAVNNSKWVYSDAYQWKMDTPTAEITNVASSGKPKISWEDVEFAEKYQIYRATSKTGTYSHLKTTTSTAFTDTSAKAGKVYYYKVRAITGNNYKSSFSSPVYIRCDLKRPVVDIKLKNGDPYLDWDKISGAEKYYIYRATSKSGEYTRIKTTKTATSFTDTTAKSGKTYYYKVKAIHSNTAANSAYSAIDSIKAK